MSNKKHYLFISVGSEGGGWEHERGQDISAGLECNITPGNCVTNVTNLILTFLNRPEPLT